MSTIAPYAKSVAATATAVSTGVITAASDGTITATEWVVVVCGAIAAGALTWAVPNKDPEGQHQDESVMPDEYEPRHDA